MSSRAKTYVVATINGTIELDIPGEYFKLMVAPAAIDVELLRDGNQALKADAVGAGFYQRIGFNKVRLTHTGVQNVTILVAPGEGGSDAFTGTFTAQGTLGTLAQQLLGGVNSLVVTDRGFAYGAAFASVTALNGATNEQILAPASNLAGVIVWAADISTTQTTAASTAQIGLLAKSSAPGSGVDGDVLLSVEQRCHTAVGMLNASAHLERAVFVATGKGLYFRNSGALETSGYRNILYTVL
jgi:hypothetical protein